MGLLNRFQCVRDSLSKALTKDVVPSNFSASNDLVRFGIAQDRESFTLQFHLATVNCYYLRWEFDPLLAFRKFITRRRVVMISCRHATLHENVKAYIRGPVNRPMNIPVWKRLPAKIQCFEDSMDVAIEIL